MSLGLLPPSARRSEPLVVYILSQSPGSSGHDNGIVWPSYFRLGSELPDVGFSLSFVFVSLYSFQATFSRWEYERGPFNEGMGRREERVNQSHPCVFWHREGFWELSLCKRGIWGAGIFLRLHWSDDMGRRNNLYRGKTSLRKSAKF